MSGALAELDRRRKADRGTNTREVDYRHVFNASSHPKGQFLHDLAVDAERGFVYVADCAPDPAIVVVDTTMLSGRRCR